MKYLALILAALLALSVFYPRKQEGDGAALRAAQQTVDSMRVAHTQDFVRYKGDNDSLKSALSDTKRRLNKSYALNATKDTVLVPVPEYVYLVDTVIPRCELCALRTDSLIAAAQAQMRATAHVEDLMRREIQGLRKTNERWKRLWPLAYAAGIGTAALLR